MSRVCAIIAAAGGASRIGCDKMLLKLSNGKTVLESSVSPFIESCLIEQVIVATSKDKVDLVGRLFDSPKLTVVVGGATRTSSVKLALEHTDCDIVLIHDGARPYVSPKLIQSVIAETEKFDSAVPAITVSDSISENGIPKNRDNFKLSQTPQGFNVVMLKQAYQSQANYTDDATAFFETFGKINYIEGEHTNIKITYPADLTLSAGIGYDLHRLVEGRKLILGGVKIPHTKGLLGHSDADVLTHAIMDALLSAVGLRDIGCYFPDVDLKYKDVSSMLLLTQVLTLIKEKGYTIKNVAATIIAQQPKLSSYIPNICKNLAKAIGLDENCVGICATTNEGVGDIGEGNAIAASAIATVIKLG